MHIPIGRAIPKTKRIDGKSYRLCSSYKQGVTKSDATRIAKGIRKAKAAKSARIVSWMVGGHKEWYVYCNG